MTDRARVVSGAVESWSPAKFLVEGTCLDCDDACTAGYEVAEGAAKLARIRRWATRHATRNAGHTAMVDVIRSRCYKVQP